MRKWTKTAGLLFLAAASVYSYQAIRGATGSKVNPSLVSASHTTHARRLAKANATPAAALPGIARGETLIDAPEGATDVKLLDESTDPFAAGAAPTSQPSKTGATASTDGAAAPTSQPSEGRSVSSSEVNVSDAGTVEIHVNDANLV